MHCLRAGCVVRFRSARYAADTQEAGRKHLAQRWVEGGAPCRSPDVSLGRAELLMGCHERRVHELRPGQALRCAALVSGGSQSERQ